MLKLGYKASAEQFAPSKLLDFSVMAEQVGLDSAFVSDHFQPWKHIDGHAPSSLVWLGALAARTSKLIMGTSVLTPTFRYHPSILGDRLPLVMNSPRAAPYIVRVSEKTRADANALCAKLHAAGGACIVLRNPRD